MAKKSLTRHQRAAACAFGMIPVILIGFLFVHSGRWKEGFGIEICTGLVYSIWVMLGKKD